VFPPVAHRERARKHPFHGRENLHHQEAVQPPEEQDLCSKSREVKENVPRVQGGRPFLSHGLVGGVPSRGDTSSFLQERGETCVRVYQEVVLKGVVKQLNMTLFSGQKWGFQQDSVPAQMAKTTQKWLRSKLLAFISAENWLSGSADLKPLDNKLWAVLEDMACRKRHNSLELLQINYLARKVDVLFNFPSSSHCICNRIYGKTWDMFMSHKQNGGQNHNIKI